MKKQLISCIYLKNEKLADGFDGVIREGMPSPWEYAAVCGNDGADAILVYDLSADESDAEHDAAIGVLIRICDASGVPVIGAGHIKRMEDVKKILYAGCKAAVLNFAKEGNRAILEEVSSKFGREKIYVYIPSAAYFDAAKEQIRKYASAILCSPETASALESRECSLPVIIHADTGDAAALLKRENCTAVTGAVVTAAGKSLMALKSELSDQGIEAAALSGAIPWEEFKTDSHGLVPCIVQDYQTDEVLMMAWMNEESYRMTLETGRMTYWSRSRKELWTKGMTSGHFQFVKSLKIDCDKDTILAKVAQIGAACHTGHRSCFFTELASREYEEKNPLRVFESVFDVIKDRKIHPREGSYTNYLFDKGIDKILKKVGEECTEIVIAAKNPDKEEIKYEIADFLYHIMVLMAEKDVSWEEITRELARR